MNIVQPDKQQQRRRTRIPDTGDTVVGLATILVALLIFVVFLVLFMLFLVLILRIRGFTVSTREDWEYLLIFALYVCAFSIGTVVIASNKHRRVDGWCIAGFFLGPIAMIIVALLPKLGTPHPSGQDQRAIPLHDDIIKTRNGAPIDSLKGDPTAWSCPKCGAVNAGTTYVCKQCTFRLA